MDELTIKAKTIFQEELYRLEPIEISSYERLLEIESDIIWGKAIVGKSDIGLSDLIKKLDMSDWVNKGLDYVNEMDEDIYPFCQKKTITKNLKEQLESLFDDEYSINITKIESLQKKYKNYFSKFLSELKEIEKEEKNKEREYRKLDTKKLTHIYKLLINKKRINQEYMNNKIKEPSRTLEILSIKEELESILVLKKKTNTIIETHNNIVANHEEERKKLKEKIWISLTLEFENEIKKYNKKKNGLKKGIQNLQKIYNNKEKNVKP